MFQQRRRGSSHGYGRSRAGLSGRMRGARGGSWRRIPTTEPPAPPLGPLLAEIYHEDLADISSVDEDMAKISGFMEVTSYSWLNEKDPTILIPGEPPAWTPLPNRTHLKEDAGQYYRDQNAARYPTYPMRPAVEAILKQRPEFPTGTIDIVACGSTLGNLLRFARKVDSEFRMVVEVVGPTVFFVRKENSPTQTIPNIHGYGHTFPEAYTTWSTDVKGSESSQRLVQYAFGGMACVVRFEADGYLPDLVPDRNEPSNKQDPSDSDDNDADRMLASALDNTSLSTRNTQIEQNSTPAILKAGAYVPHAALFELKTRSFRKKDNDILGEELPRLWASQIPNFVLAFHQSGQFDPENINIRNVQEETKRWEEDNKDSLGQLAVLLKLLVDFARARPDGRFELTHEEGGRALTLHEIPDDVARVLPGGLSARWPWNGSEDGHPEPNLTHDLISDCGSVDYTLCDAEVCGYCGHCGIK